MELYNMNYKGYLIIRVEGWFEIDGKDFGTYQSVAEAQQAIDKLGGGQ